MTPAHDRVFNWARWANNCDPRISYPSICSGFAYMVHETSDMDGWGDTSKEARLPPVDIPDARDVVDVYIMTLPGCHVLTIKNWYIRYPWSEEREAARKQLKPEDVATAIRLLADRLPQKIYLRKRSKPDTISGRGQSCP